MTARPDEKAPIEFPPELPITAKVAEIATAIDAHPVVIVAGATGSGKTTQLPKIALAMGRGLEKIIGVTQPRRIAATSVAARVATELGSPLGTDVGYQIRFDDRTSPATYVKFMTDGILLAEIHGDPLLRKYDTLVLDEAHERSLTIDFLLGWVKRILPQRPDLKVVVSSATLETERFSAFFGGAPVVTVEGRTFPVEVLYEPPADDADVAEAVANAVAEVTSLDPRGDVLVFLPGEREIREAENELRTRNLRHTLVAPLYGRLAAADQNKVFATTSERRVILATNVAETSVTIPGIVYVIDAGLARLSRYDPRSGTTRQQIEGISQASAEQRKGRCGRVRDGICVRLYDEASYAARPAFTDPEIKRTGLAGVILRMKALGLGDVEEFPFLDPPNGKAVAEGYRVLEELGALDAGRNLTTLGQRLARFPVDPRLGRMILAGVDLGCLREVLVVVAGLSIQDPRERPRELAQRADDAHRRFKDERSDFVGLLRMWDVVREADRKSRGQLRRLCKESFLSFISVREWFEVHRQLEETVRELRLSLPAGAGGAHEDEDALHRALLSGLLSKVGQWNPEQRIYIGAKQTRFAIHPSSGLARKSPAWVMAFELVETSQLFARMVAKIEPEQLLAMGGHLLKRSYSDPHWSEKSARASVKEHATLFGLTVARDRSVDYASVAPAAARRIFLDHALVRGEYTSRGAFQKKNRELLEEAARLRAKARRSDMFADDDALIAFFEARVPDDVVNGKTFEAWRERVEREDPRRLLLALEDVLVGEPDLSPAAYPDEIAISGTPVKVAYRFDPSAEDDGITLTVPLILLPQLEPGALDWTIPGWHEGKLAALLDELPRSARRDLGDLRSLARAIAPLLVPFSGPYVPAVVRAIADETGVTVAEEAFRPDAVATYLRATTRVVDVAGKVVAQSREADDVLRRFGAKARAALTASAPASTWAREGLTSWSFGELPSFVVRKVRDQEVRTYPAIVDRGKSVALELLETEAAAARATRAGVERLLALATGSTLSAIAPRLPRPLPRFDGAPSSRAEVEAFRAALLDRIVEAAFRLDDPTTPLPRSAKQLDALVAVGKTRLEPAARVFSDALAPIATELEKLLGGLKRAGQQPSGRLAMLDIQAQLGELFPADFIRTVPFERLERVPRYLRAAQARFQRAIADPRKDADKHAPLAPLWKAFLAKRASFRDVQAAEELRWSFEELRVAIFAPELRTPSPVSVAKVAAALAALR